VNIQEVIYGTIMPVAVLRFFGAAATGIFAVVGRLVQASLMPQDSFLLPVLSGSSLIFAAGSFATMRVLVLKAFKTTFGLSVVPLAVICSCGTTILYAWTGHRSGNFEPFLVLMSLAGLFQALSMLQLVLYRASGKTLMDNIRQAIRIAVLLAVGFVGKRLGILGILGGLCISEFAGMAFMFFALRHAFPWFTVRSLLPDVLKLMLVAGGLAALSLMVIHIPVPFLASGRSLALVHTCVIGGVTVCGAIPLLLLTGALSSSEFRLIRGLIPGSRRKLYASS